MNLVKNESFGISFSRSAACGAPSTSCIFAAKPSGAERGRVDIGSSLAFAGVYLFTILLYARPNEVFPGLLGAFPITKLVAIATTAIYIISRLNYNKPLTILPFEIKMIGLIALLAVIFMPTAASPQDTIDVLLDAFFKIIIIFVLMINLIDTRQRLHSSLQLVVIGGSVLGLDAIRSFVEGELYRGRIQGALGGEMFGNPNDLASWLNMLLPLAVVLALTNKGIVRFAYLAVAILIALAILLTFSRGGFVGLIIMGGVLVWKLRRRNPLLPVAAVTLIVGALIVLMPTSYGARMSTIFRPDADPTGSAQQRQAVLERGLLVAARHTAVGIGMGNFHIYSLRELKAHNAYVEIWAELGAVGFLAYCALILGSLRNLRRLELASVREQDKLSTDTYYLSVGLQSAVAAYMVCSLFASIQYAWFLYFPVAYAVSLKTIRDREDTRLDGKSGEVETLFGRPANGLLWRLQQRASGAAHTAVTQLALRGETKL